MLDTTMCKNQTFEDTKEVIRNCILKTDRQYNSQKKKDNRQTVTYIHDEGYSRNVSYALSLISTFYYETLHRKLTNDWATRTSLNIREWTHVFRIGKPFLAMLAHYLISYVKLTRRKRLKMTDIFSYKFRAQVILKINFRCQTTNSPIRA